MSAFEQLKRDGVIQRGRKANLDGQQKEKKQNFRAEARRRAGLVLQHKYRAEFEALVDSEMRSMKSVTKDTGKLSKDVGIDG